MLKHSHLLTFLTAMSARPALFHCIGEDTWEELIPHLEGLSPSDAEGYLPGKGMRQCCGDPSRWLHQVLGLLQEAKSELCHGRNPLQTALPMGVQWDMSQQQDSAPHQQTGWGQSPRGSAAHLSPSSRSLILALSSSPQRTAWARTLLISSTKTPCVRAGGSLHTPSVSPIHLQAILRTLHKDQILTSTFALICWRFSSGICPIGLLLFRKNSLRVTSLLMGKYHFVRLIFICHLHTHGVLEQSQ